MCGRFTLLTPTSDVGRFFRTAVPLWLTPRANIAPTQSVLGIRLSQGNREAALFRWGLVPSWAEDPKLGHRMINARCETIATSTAYRDAFRQRRCLIVADGFYVGQPIAAMEPYYFRRPDGQPFAFAGLWECWQSGEQTIESCTIITTEASAPVESAHIRLPVILAPDDYDSWLDPEFQDIKQLQTLLRAAADDELQAVAVPATVGGPRSDRPACVDSVAAN